MPRIDFDANIPIWVLAGLLVAGFFISFWAINRRVRNPARGLLFISCAVAGAAIITSTGPVVQSFFEAAMYWNDVSLAVREIKSLSTEQRIIFAQNLLVWGLLPAILSATAAIATSGWVRKIIRSSLAAFAGFLVMDVLSYYSGPRAHSFNLIYTVHVNVVGGMLAGGCVGSIAHFLETRLVPGIGLLRDAQRERKVFSSSVASLAVLMYVCWLLFIQRPDVPVRLVLSQWRLLDVSPLGDSPVYTPEQSHLSLATPHLLASGKGEAILDIKGRVGDGNIRIWEVERVQESAEGLDKLSQSPRSGRLLFDRPIPSGRIVASAEYPWLTLLGKKDSLLVRVEASPYGRLLIYHDEAKSAVCYISATGLKYGQPSVMRLTADNIESAYVGSYGNTTLKITNELHRIEWASRTKRDFRMDFKQILLESSLEVNRFELETCSPVVEHLPVADLFRADVGGGHLRTGLKTFQLSTGDKVALFSGFILTSVDGKGHLVAEGHVKGIAINNVSIDESRWDSYSIEMRTTIVAWFLGTVAAWGGWLWKQKSSMRKGLG